MQRVGHRARAVVARVLPRPWPPPYLYGLSTISLPAAITCLTSSGGADAGATAVPSAPSVAFSPAGGGGGRRLGRRLGRRAIAGARPASAACARRERDTRPLTRAAERRSHDAHAARGARPVLAVDRGLAARRGVRKSCSTRTSRPAASLRSVRSPKRSALGLSGTGRQQRAPKATRPTASERQRDTTDDPFLSAAYGVSCRARAERVALRRDIGGDSPLAGRFPALWFPRSPAGQAAPGTRRYVP